MTLLAAGALPAVLGAAVLCDVREHRIPNVLIVLGLAAGLACNALAPPGSGFFDAARPGSLGVLQAMAGAATGFALFLPLYVVRAMGAGDVKLMAVMGAFLGAPGVADAVLLTFVCGGIFAGGVAAWNGVLSRALSNVRFMLTDALVRALGTGGGAVEPAALSAGKVPYAIAIAAGTGLSIAMARIGCSIFSS